MSKEVVAGACLLVTSSSGLPLGVELGGLGVPCGDRRSEPGAIIGVAALVVGGPVA